MMFRILSVVFLAALAACAPAPGTERLSAGRTVDIASAGAQLSVQRAGRGIVRPLVHSPGLQAAAQAHADDQARAGTLAHRGSDGSTLSRRLNRVGYDACAAAENISRGQPDVRTVITGWMGSQGHRANILNPQVTQFGFAQSADVWVLVLGRPCA